MNVRDLSVEQAAAFANVDWQQSDAEGDWLDEQLDRQGYVDETVVGEVEVRHGPAVRSFVMRDGAAVGLPHEPVPGLVNVEIFIDFGWSKVYNWPR